MAAENLKGSIEFTVSQLNACKVLDEMKLRRSRSLVRRVEALNKISGNSEADLDLASYLAGLEKIPRKFNNKQFVTVVKTVQARTAGRNP